VPIGDAQAAAPGEGGDAGGTLVATGTPEEIARKAGSWTGKYLRSVLK